MDPKYEYILHKAAGPHWKRIGIKRRFGIVAPLFSLRSERGCGIGDAGDLYDILPWMAEAGIDLIQLLPINDTGLDAVPYSALSAFALDPIYVALDRIPGIERFEDFLGRVQATADRLNQSESVDYHAVRSAKLELLEAALGLLDGPELDQAMRAFVAQQEWLPNYLAYRVIKELEGYSSWENWQDRFNVHTAYEDLSKSHPQRMRLFLFAQWVLFQQFVAARQRAEELGVLIEGDIPIMVARDSADVWKHRELFRMDVTAGAPPDMFTADGQNWGFPTYQWPAHKQQDYAWWRKRLQYAQNFFHMYRIDHVVGFFRIWTIMAGEKTGRNGWFEPWDEAVWGEHGKNLLLMMLDASHMLPLAEDLGTIPDICRQTLEELGICGFKVQRWEKRWHGDRKFIPPAEYIPLSMATLSTHDSEILAQWWAENHDDRVELAQMLGYQGDPGPVLDLETHKKIITWIKNSGSLFVVLMIQELLGAYGNLPGDPAKHRINIPGQVLDTNWTWRSPMTIKQMLADTNMTQGIKNL